MRLRIFNSIAFRQFPRPLVRNGYDVAVVVVAYLFSCDTL